MKAKIIKNILNYFTIGSIVEVNVINKRGDLRISNDKITEVVGYQFLDCLKKIEINL